MRPQARSGTTSNTNIHIQLRGPARRKPQNTRTPNDVELVRFQMNEPLTKYSRSTATSSSWYTNVPLLKRYKMFENSKMKRLIMKEIKKCII